jgi:hypothetical protein
MEADMTPVERMKLADLVAALDRTHAIVADLLDQLELHGGHETAGRFALDAVVDAADYLFNLRDGGE